MFRSLLFFIFGRAVPPIGVIIQLFFLARMLPDEEYADFLEFYSLAVVCSAISDFGERHRFFAAARGMSSGQTQLAARFALSLCLKLMGTTLAVLLAIVPLGSSHIDLQLRIAAAFFGAMMPVGDVALTLLRGVDRPGTELWFSLFEVIVSVAAIVIFGSLGTLSIKSAVALMMIGSAGRLLAGQIAVHRLMAPDWRPLLAQPWASLRKEILDAAPACVSVVSAQVFMRAPALTLRSSLTTEDYAVFNTFVTLLQRTDLLLSALVQASFKSRHAALKRAMSDLRIAVLISAIPAVIMVLITFLWSQTIVALCLGQTYANSHQLALYASLAMIVTFPAFTCRLRLQLLGHSRVVILASIVGILLQFGGMALNINGTDVALFPYFLATLAFGGVIIYAASREGIWND